MSKPRPYEDELLAGAREHLQFVSITHGAEESGESKYQVALDVVEAAASRLGGFSLAAFRRLDDRERVLNERTSLDAASVILQRIGEAAVIPAPLALCSLARQPLPPIHEKKLGSFYTDFRLAQHVARRLGTLARESVVVDPACGTGTLLVACGLAACGPDRHASAHWLAERAFGADLSPAALDGARIALASLCDDLGAIRQMQEHLLHQDSLLAPLSVWPTDFDVVVANPPWEKVKATRHEFLQAQGTNRHYGASYGQTAFAFSGYEAHRRGRSNYAALLAERYSTLRGEADLYIAFTELLLRLLRNNGRISALVPAGLVRSQGTESLRRLLLKTSSSLDLQVLENRARFFGIDTRFKFLSLVAEVGTDRRTPVKVRHGRGTRTDIEETGTATIGRGALSKLRPDLSVPEVRSESEWRLFAKLSGHGEDWTAPRSAWRPRIVREVDMTRDRGLFINSEQPGSVPLIEGRMVHQHRFGAKGYRSGTGRRARWDPLEFGALQVEPQYWIPLDRLSPTIRERAEHLRVGFCDITGQTNERSLLAAAIPNGVTCGNKVPTITFENDPSEDRLFVWLAIANSFAFDWMLRRVVTTTVNYFLLQSIPLPYLRPKSLPWRALTSAARKLQQLATGADGWPDLWTVAEARVAIDLATAIAYGATYEDIVLMLDDFPLLDRGQPPIAGEDRSTVTRDFVLERAAARFREPATSHAERLAAARAAGAVPYVPSDLAAATRPRTCAGAENGTP